MTARKTVLVVVAVAALATMTLGAAAQDAEAPHPSPEMQTLYAHGTGDDEENGFMNTLVDDGDDNALGAGSLVNGDRTWTLTLAPALAGTVALDPEGTIDVTAYIGASQGVGRVTVTTELSHGETVVASGDGQTHTITPANAESDGLYGEVTWSLAPETTTLAPGADLVWTITAQGTASAIFLGIGEGRGRSNIVLPILSVGLAPDEGDVVVENITQPLVAIELSFNETTTASYRHNWTAPASAAYNLTAQAELENGTVTFAVVDADDSEVAGGTVNATEGEASNEIRDAAPGNWTIRIDVENATGTFRLDIAPAPPFGNPAGTATAGNQTGNATASEDDQLAIPGPGLAGVATGLALAALAIGARRKRV